MNIYSMEQKIYIFRTILEDFVETVPLSSVRGVVCWEGGLVYSDIQHFCRNGVA